MFSKKIRLDRKEKTISVATALVLMAIDEIISDEMNPKKVVYGYQIMSHLKDVYGWDVKSGTVYPILKKLVGENFIRKGVSNLPTQTNRRQTIYYKINQKGKKLAKKIKSLNDEALEAALSPNVTSLPAGSSKWNLESFTKDNFTQLLLRPFLLEFESKISMAIMQEKSNESLNEIQNEIQKSIEEMDGFRRIFESNISKIKKRMNIDGNPN
ncbi:MAG: PadR family transcriptional regulator [Promethearchaeota archaeon]